MDPAALTVIFKGIGMLMAILGGVLIAWYGFRLYRDGVGQGRDKAAFEVGKVKVTANSVGSVVMCTAFLWAYAGVLLSPKYEKTPDVTRVYSMRTPAGDIEATSIPTKSSGLRIEKFDVVKIEALFKKTLADPNQQKSFPFVTLGGKPATIQFGSERAMLRESGDLVFSTQVMANGKTAELQYEAKLDNGSIVFVPSQPKPKDGNF